MNATEDNVHENGTVELDSDAMEMEVDDVIEATAPDDTTSVTAVTVIAGDGHEFTISFRDRGNDVLELFSDDSVADTDRPHQLQGAVMAAIEYLRTQDNGKQIVLESNADDPEYTGPFTTYTYGGGETAHIYENESADAICDTATVTAGRRDLDDLTKPVSSVDGICPKCLRELKFRGHFEAYERPPEF